MKRLLTICAVVALMLSLGITANAATWNVPGDFATIQDAIDSSLVVNGDKIMVGPGNHAGAVVTKAVEIKGEGGAVINTGMSYGPTMIGFYFPSEGGGGGATISHLQFDEAVGFAIMSGGVDDVTVTQCTLNNTLQGISNWCGSGWEISHNEIIDLRSDCGGGIGILVADYKGGVVKDNVVSHNKITGILHVAPDDCGGYSGSGIDMYADFRWGGAGAEKITNNRVVKNKVSLVSNTPEVVDVVAIGLSQAYYPADPPDPLPKVVYDNAIGFNDLRGTVLQLDITPGLEAYNKISRNLGDNRGHGLHPSAFVGPGGN